MTISNEYILSQIFSIIAYILLGTTFFVKNRKTVVIIGIFQSIFLMIGYFFLKQYQGMMMVTVSLLTSIVLFIDELKFGKSKNISKKDIIILISLIIYTFILTIITYSTPLSLLSVAATLLWMISVWIKDVKIYKLLSIPDVILWLAFNIYAKSISGIIVEIILLTTSVSGYALEIRRKERIE